MSESNLVRDCLIVDGAGWSPHSGCEVALKITDELEIGPEPWYGPTIIIDPHVVTDLVIQGKTQTSGTRLWGGGFGLEGAAVGIGIASLINGLTRNVESWTLVKVETCDGFATIQINESEDRVRHLLRSFRDAIYAVESGDERNANHDREVLMEHLERLAELRTSGMLDESEFQAAKSRILGL